MQQGSQADETALLREVVEGDRNALAALYRLYHTPLFRFAFRLTNSYGTAEELVNDVMLAVWKNASQFRHGSKVSTWVFGIAYRQCMSCLRRKRVTIVPDVRIDQIADSSRDAVEDSQWIEQGLAELPDEQRVSMMLVFYLGCSYGEVAEITGCKEATVKTRMFHARRKLRSSLPSLADPVNQEVTS
ncbi:MAG: RNA polymerase sigma factor [Woeseiaceae bacterium]|nr:RNA polymerase sigma factor [Woeseiaceae bacterium]